MDRDPPQPQKAPLESVPEKQADHHCPVCGATLLQENARSSAAVRNAFTGSFLIAPSSEIQFPTARLA